MNPIDRRSFLGVAGGAGALPLLAAAPAAGQEADGASAATATALLPYQEESRARRMKWWHDAKFGMFIHYGLYSDHRAPGMGDGIRRHSDPGL